MFTMGSNDKRHYIVVNDVEEKVLTLTNKKLNEMFTPHQVLALHKGQNVICNDHHGNQWVKRVNATAQSLLAIYRHGKN